MLGIGDEGKGQIGARVGTQHLHRRDLSHVYARPHCSCALALMDGHVDA